MLRTRLAVALAALALSADARADVVVVSAQAGGDAAKAHLKPGDRLVSWRRAPTKAAPAASGTFAAPWDVEELELSEVPRGPATVAYRRAGRNASALLGRGEWRLGVRADAEGADSELAHALAAAAAAAAQARHAEALELWQEALAFARRRGDERMRARILALEPPSFRATRRLADGEAALREALAIRERLDARGPATASVLLLLAAHLRQGRLERDAAEALARRALDVAREGAPGSLVESRALRQLGSFAWDHGDLDAFRARNEEALVLARRLAPDGIDTMQCLSNIAFEASARGRDAEAERLQLEALAIGLKRFPVAPETGQVWNGLGVLAYKRGDLVTADERYEKAFAIWSKALPGTLSVIGVLSNLANDARERGDVALAEARHRTLLAMREAIAPDSNDVGRSCQSLANILRLERRLPEATAFAGRALEIARKNTPEGVLLVSALAELGLADLAAGRLDEAEAHVREGIALATRIAPLGADAANLRTALAEILAAKGRLADAESAASDAVARRRSAPGTLSEAEALRVLASVGRARGNLDEAEATYERALASMEAQAARMGGTEESAAFFATRTADVYQEAIDLLLSRGKQGEALHVLERSRARQFLVSLKARALAPAFGATDHLDLTGIRAALPRGTLLLSYAVLPERTVLFVVRARGDAPEGEDGLHVHDIPLAADALAREAGIFRSLVDADRAAGAPDPALLAQARRLYDLLVAPAAPLVAGAARLLIAADGPLQTLPFAALKDADGAWLAERKPLVFAPSATAWASLRARARRQPAGPPHLVAFADPALPPEPAGGEPGATRGGSAAPLVRYRRGLAALPFAREEARAVARAWHGPSAVFTGDLATKARALGVGPGTRVLHFATHALVDRRFPLDSGLALASKQTDAPGETSGLLQAWEVLESMHLDADLVTLSGCETGLGSEGSGEGLVGLVRAFQIAGARTVAASLWSVSDRSTMELMTRFYRALAGGQHPDEALRTAQRALIAGEAGPAFAQPWHWAAFELFGDGR